jgi:transcriptional regulator with XRE-family HTH domain
MPVAMKTPDPVDIYVGDRVRQRRKMLGLSQEELGALIGLTFQQVQKYERGANRISASKLFQIAKALKIRIAYFFDGYSDEDDAEAGEGTATSEKLVLELLSTPRGVELAGAFPRIRGENLRCRIVDLVSALAEA